MRKDQIESLQRVEKLLTVLHRLANRPWESVQGMQEANVVFDACNDELKRAGLNYSDIIRSQVAVEMMLNNARGWDGQSKNTELPANA